MRLTKSLVAAFDQCPKQPVAGSSQGAPSMENPQDDLRKAEGERIGMIARSLFSNGKLVAHYLAVGAALEETQTLLATSSHRPIFERRSSVKAPMSASIFWCRCPKGHGISSK